MHIFSAALRRTCVNSTGQALITAPSRRQQLASLARWKLLIKVLHKSGVSHSPNFALLLAPVQHSRIPYGEHQQAQRPRDARATDMASAAPSDTASTGPAPAREVMAIRDLLGSTLLVKRDGSVKPTALSVLDGKYIGIYFSANWCPPCRAFTPRLAKTYEQLVAAGKPFEIIFVSSDKAESEFNEYYGQMPWAAVPYGAQAVRANLARQFAVSGIPTLIILAPDGTIISKNARDAVLRKPDSFPWEGADASRSGLGLNNILLYILLAWLLYRVFFSK